MSDVNVLRNDAFASWTAAVGRTMAWLKARERTGLFIAVGVQVAVLVSMGVTHAMPLLFGETVLVRVVPVDPRDFFRGDYVILGYEFSQMPPGGIEGLTPETEHYGFREHQGRTVYVSLVREGDGKHLKAGKMSVHKPEEGPFLRGRLTGWNRITYGIEAFYLQEGRGREYEQAIFANRLSAELAVMPDGRAALRGLHIADSPAPDGPAGLNVAEEAEEATEP